MSQENVEKLRELLEGWDPKAQVAAFRRGDVSGLPDLALIDPQVTFEDNVLPDHAGATYHGFEGIVRATEQWMEPYENVVIDLERVVDGGECVISIHRALLKAQHTGIELESPLAYIWRFRAGKIIEIRGYLDPDEALKAAGLSE
jgi:ketosteroid isomerase-like protein